MPQQKGIPRMGKSLPYLNPADLNPSTFEWFHLLKLHHQNDGALHSKACLAGLELAENNLHECHEQILRRVHHALGPYHHLSGSYHAKNQIAQQPISRPCESVLHFYHDVKP